MKSPDPKLPLHKYVAAGGKPEEWKRINKVPKKK